MQIFSSKNICIFVKPLPVILFERKTYSELWILKEQSPPVGLSIERSFFVPLTPDAANDFETLQ